MNIDVEFHIRHNYPWCKLPANMRQRLGNSQREYEKQAVLYSIYEHRYYEELLKYSQDHLMLYPYHLLDIMMTSRYAFCLRNSLLIRSSIQVLNSLDH
uniref:FAM91 N-terminal domain-containing protein n=1 Tax=Cebus imitator TaxID=2715852 RepID=A0A2K5SIS3_CEBIM